MSEVRGCPVARRHRHTTYVTLSDVMVTRVEERPPQRVTDSGLIGAAPASPAGPLDPTELDGLRPPPTIPLPRTVQVLRFNQRQIEFVFGARRRLGDVFRMRGTVGGDPVITGHPDHVRSLFTAKPEQAPSLTGESPLRPIVGPNSVLTAIGPRHMRQRKLLLPPFHGDAIDRYTRMIETAAEREIERWPLGRPFALAPRMQAITLDVIMSGIFGIEGRPRPGTAEHWLRQAVKRLVAASTWPVAQLAELDERRPRRARGRDQGRADAARHADLRGDRPAPAGRRPRPAPRHPLAAAARPHRGRRGAHRPRAPRRAAHPGARRPRDDRELARLGVGAAGAGPGAPTSACARRCARTRRPRRRSSG